MFDSLFTKLSRLATLTCLLVAVAAAPVSTYSQQLAKPEIPFAAGEELVYQAEFNRSLLRGVNVGELRFSAKPSGVATGPVRSAHSVGNIQLVGDAIARGFLLRLFGSHFHLHVESTVNSDFEALQTKKVEEDRRRVRVSEAVFDHKARKVTWTESIQNQNEPPKVTTVDFTEPIQDVLSVIYFVRTQPLKPGQTFEVPLTDNNRVYRCTVTVVERKKIKSILGRVDAVRVEPAIFGDDRVIRSRGTLSIWVTDDARRIPVKAQLKVPIGTFDINLKRISSSKSQPAR